MALWMVAGILGQITKVRPNPTFDVEKARVVGIALPVYAVAMFVYFYRFTDGATGVSVQGGHFVALYKGHGPKVITYDQYVMYPILAVRCLIAWCGMLAWFGGIGSR